MVNFISEGDPLLRGAIIQIEPKRYFALVHHMKCIDENVESELDCSLGKLLPAQPSAIEFTACF